VEDENIINSPKFLKLIDNYGDIYFKYNNHIEKITHNSKMKEPIKLITYKELLLDLAAFKNKSINYFYEQGLNKKINPKSIISLMLNNNITNTPKLESYDFSYKENNKIIYDIPYYHENVPEGFSVFCTDEEYDLVLNYVNKKRKKPKANNKIKEEDITSVPEPTKKNYICHLCRVFFDNYKKHINSEKHYQMVQENKSYFNNLSTTFKRIVKNNKNNFNKSLSTLPDLISEKKEENKSNYYLRKENNNNNYLCEKYFDDYIILNKVKNKSNIRQQMYSTASTTLKNSSFNF
jgi:hypothetical protein